MVANDGGDVDSELEVSTWSSDRASVRGLSSASSCVCVGHEPSPSGRRFFEERESFDRTCGNGADGRQFGQKEVDPLLDR